MEITRKKYYRGILDEKDDKMMVILEDCYYY